MKVLLLSSLGDPKNPKLWSGTPENIYQQLKIFPNVEVETGNVLIFDWMSKFLSAIEFVFKMDLHRSKLRSFVSTGFLFLKYRKKLGFYDQVFFFDTVANPGILRNAANSTTLSLILDSTVAQWKTDTEWGLRASLKRKRRRMNYERRVFSELTSFYPLSIQASNSLVEDFNIKNSQIVRVRTGAGQPLTQIQPPKVFRDNKQISLLTIAKGEHWRKGIDVLFQSLSFDSDGKIKELNALLGQNYRHNVPDRVNSFGFVSLEKLISFYKSADIFILPCRFEPYGLVFVEAVRMGLPIVTTANSGLGREFVDAGWPGAIVDLAPGSIIEGILNVHSRVGLGEGAVENLQAEILSLFDWTNLASDILER
jgi:glycosyltransferase involved in cell wall biosynthesis